MENGGNVPKFRHLTVEERRLIISMHMQNFSHRHIASVLEKSHTCIGKVIRAYKTEGRVLAKPRPGRPKTTTKRTDQQILNLSEANPFLSAPKIQARLTNEAVKPSTSTIRRRLISAGKHGRVARRVPFLNKANIKKRMQFYITHALKPATYWENVLWTDESMIRMSYSHGQMFVWRKQCEALSFKCTRPTLKSMGRGLMMWGCISAYGVGKIVLLEGRVCSRVYLNLMKDVIIPEGKRLIGDEFVLQQDNAPIHTAKIVKDFVASSNINVLEWPPQSPDLAPIENVWSILKIRVAERTPRSLAELKTAIMESWSSITPAECRKAILSMPTRIGIMSQRNGGHCGY